MKKLNTPYSWLLLLIGSLITSNSSFAQGIGINSTGANPDASAILDVSSTTKGTLITRMSTTQRDSISSPAEGLQIYNITTKCIEIYEGNIWQALTCACTSVPAAAGTITGASAVCTGQMQVYSVPAIANATGYVWSYSGTGASIVGSTNTVIVYFSQSATSGNLTVRGTNACGNGTASSDLSIAANSTSNITGQPSSPAAVCAGAGTATFTVTATGTGLTYQWQEYTGAWANITNGGIYSGATSTTLTLTNPTAGMNGYKYRCVVSTTCASDVTTNGTATLTVNPATVGGSVNSASVCSGLNSTLLTLSGNTGSVSKWQYSLNGTSWTDIANTNTTYTTTNLTATTQYRAVVQSGVCSAANSNAGTITIVTVTPDVEYLVVGGGGGGGSSAGGGGGAGGFVTGTGYAVSSGTPITVTVGAGGPGMPWNNAGINGGNSVFGSLTANGGGCGGTQSGQGSNGSNGGSGGGAAGGGTGGIGSQGHNGATAIFEGGGGGGASADGLPNLADANGGNGGDGLPSSITGTTVYYAGGGGGGSGTTGGTGGTGGAGGGATGATRSANTGGDGTANTGGGGGGAGGFQSAHGGSGGSGVVIIRYADTCVAPSSTTGSPTVTATGGYRIYKWTGSGSVTF